MAAKKKKSRKKLDATIRRELFALLAIALSILALSETWGIVGRSLKLFLRFFFGNWSFIVPPVVIFFSLTQLIRRRLPALSAERRSGWLLLYGMLLLFAHMELFTRLTEDGGLTQSILQETWSRFLLEARGETPLAIGGGMVGAVLFTVFYFLFGYYGSLLVGLVLSLISVILITGISLNRVFLSLRKQLRNMRRALRRIGKQIGQSMRALADRFWQGRGAGQKKQAQTKGNATAREDDAPPMPKKALEAFDASWPEETEQVELPIIVDFADRTLDSSDFTSSLSASSSRHDENTVNESPRERASAPEQVSVADVAVDIKEKASDVVPSYTHGAGTVYDGVTPGTKIPFMKDTDTESRERPLFPSQSSPPSETSRSLPSKSPSESGGDGSLPGEIEIEKPYTLPPLVLLDRPKRPMAKENKRIMQNAQKLEQTLASFGVQAKVLHIHRGPAVTRYEIQPDIGVKVSRIVSLTDDIALALAARDIRMEAPIPGKSAIGIEVPNDDIAVVTIREVLESAEFQQSPSKLTLALGRDISGEPVIGDLTKMPHLLVAGATGSGKSVSINTMIASILHKARPDEVKFVMIDPKMVELSIYNDIPHMLSPVVTDSRKAQLVLKKMVVEMETRYEAFAKAGAKDLERFNEIVIAHGSRPLPLIVVIVDELADLMMVAGHEVEESIARLSQKARAAGIHLIIATQRPSVDVITGVIKANIPSRIAFGVSSQVDSRTILDMAGAEKLLGRGDMLYMPVGAAKAIRVQGCFISEREIHALVDFIRKQKEPAYDPELVSDREELSAEMVDDPLFERAVEIVLDQGSASASLLQRRLSIGYARAARLIDMMEEQGIVGPYEGSKPRKVLIDPAQYNRESGSASNA